MPPAREEYGTYYPKELQIFINNFHFSNMYFKQNNHNKLNQERGNKKDNRQIDEPVISIIRNEH